MPAAKRAKQNEEKDPEATASTAESQDDNEAEEPLTEAEEQREAARIAQNLPPGSVPEQRPQASQQIDESDTKSDLTRRLEEAEHPSIPVNEPMPQEAYDRADSQEQKDKAAEESVSEGIMVGNRVESTTGVHEGRIFAVTRILNYQDVSSLVARLAGDPSQLYSKPKEIEATAIGDERDGERLILNVEDDGLVKLNESFAGTRAGRRH